MDIFTNSVSFFKIFDAAETIDFKIVTCTSCRLKPNAYMYLSCHFQMNIIVYQLDKTPLNAMDIFKRRYMVRMNLVHLVRTKPLWSFNKQFPVFFNLKYLLGKYFCSSLTFEKI